MDDVAFTEFALILLVASAVGVVFTRLRQPLLIAYIVVGIALSPAVFGLVTT